MITAIGVSYLLQNVMIFFSFSPDVRPFPPAIARKTYSIGFVEVSNIQLLILAVSLALMIPFTANRQENQNGKSDACC